LCICEGGLNEAALVRRAAEAHVKHMSICPLCARPTSDVLRRFTLCETAETFCPEMLGRDKYLHMQRILEQLWSCDHVEVLRCGHCDFGFSDPFVAGNAEFYNLQAPDTPYPRDKWEYRRTLRVFAGLRGSVRSVLDVGAGKGYFLRHLISDGWSPGQLESTEFSITGRRAIEALGASCHPMDVRQLKDSGKQFDAICMFQVLEHCDGYDALLDALGSLTAPNAHLFIAVPNGRRVDFDESVGVWFDRPPNHISRWTPDSFGVFAAKYGWRIEEIELEPAPSVASEAAYGAINTFLVNSHRPGSWARWSYGQADRWFDHRSKANKAVKAAAMALSPGSWRAALKLAAAARVGAVPHSLWVHLRKA